VLQFDKAGNLLQAWGGPADPGFLEKQCRAADGCYWPGREHGIFVDHNDFVWISGNGERARGTNSGEYPWAANFGGDDSQILKFKKDGTFVLAIGKQGMTKPNSNDTNGGLNGTPQPYLPADFTVDPKTNIMYIADGYGNRRVLVVDAATGKYIGHFGAYGQNPVVGESTDPAYGGAWAADFRRAEMKPKYFRSPLHCAELSKDGLLYLCDRGNNRIQVFKATEVGKLCQNSNGEAGKCGFVGEIHVAPQTASGTSGSLAFSTDPEQSCLYVADLTNFTIYEINRKTLQEIDRFGRGGKGLGQFHWPHKLSVDSEGNVYVGDVDGNGNVQKFLRYGASACSGTGHAEIGSYRTTN
jgi:DNA-binding beta-propeller fold protein YncE